MASNDFVTINGQYVRVTSFTRDETQGPLSLVVIVRGDAAREEMLTLLRDQPLTVAMGAEPPLSMRVAGIDLRSSGEGARTIHRFAITLEPASADATSTISPGGPSSESALMQRLDAIERKLDYLIALMDHRS